MAFDLQSALKAGYSPTEIADYLASQRGFDIAAARSAGYTDQDLLGELTRPVKEAGALESAADSALALGQGLISGAKMISDAFGADNSVSKKLDSAGKTLGGLESEERKVEKNVRAAKIKTAEESGSTTAEVGAYLGSFAEAPLDTTLQAVGTIAPTVAGLFIPGVRETTLARLAATVGLGTVQGAGAVKGSISDAVERKLLEDGISPEAAAQAAADAQSYTGENAGQIALGAGLGGVAGRFGVEGLISKGIGQQAAKTIAGRIGTGAVAEGAPEFIQGGQERVASNIAVQNQGYDVPTFQGAVGQGALEAVSGGTLGGGLAALGSRQRANTPAPAPAPANLPDLKLDAEQALADLTAAVDPYVGAAPVLGAASVDEAIQTAQATTTVPDLASPPMDLVQKRAMVDRNSALLAEADKAGTEFEKQLAKEQAKLGLPQAQQGAATGFADLTPMNPRQAGARLVVMRDQVAQQGGNALELAIVPHPAQAGAFAIGRQPLPDLSLPATAPAPLNPAVAQNRIESAAMVGTEQQRRAQDAPRQDMISRTMAAIEARGGVASPYEAELLRAANMGQPFGRIDPSIGRPASTDEKLTLATGIAVGQEAGLGFGARESTTQRVSAPFQYTPGAQGNKRAETAAPAAAAAPSIERTFVEQMRGTNTPAARAFVQQYESGQISDADVRQALGINSQPATSQQRIEQAAAQAAPGQTTGIQVAPSTARAANPALAEAVELYGNKPLTDADLTVEGATARVARAGARAPAPQTDGLEISTPGSRAEFPGRAEAITTGNRQPRPARVGGVPAAQLSNEQLSQTAGNDALPAITRRSAQIELMARQQEQRGQSPRGADVSERLEAAAAAAAPQTDEVSGRLEAAATEGKLAQPSAGRIITTGAKFSTQRLAPGSKNTVNETETVKDAQGNPVIDPATGEPQTRQIKHEYSVVDVSRLGPVGKLLQQIARIFGKRIVVYESATLKADGFVNDGDNQNIFINARSTISPLAVFGHELTHLIKRDNPAAYKALEAVVRAQRTKIGEAGFAAEYGDDSADLLEELSSDLVGNRFQEPGFWLDVFNEIRAQNPEKAQGIITRLGAALNKAVNAVLKTITQQGFGADFYVDDLKAVKAAVKDALVQYAQSQQQSAMQMETELARAEGRINMNAGSAPAAKQPFGYTPELQGNKRDQAPAVVDGEELEVEGAARPRAEEDDASEVLAGPQTAAERQAAAVARARGELERPFPSSQRTATAAPAPAPAAASVAAKPAAAPAPAAQPVAGLRAPTARERASDDSYAAFDLNGRNFRLNTLAGRNEVAVSESGNYRTEYMVRNDGDKRRNILYEGQTFPSDIPPRVAELLTELSKTTVADTAGRDQILDDLQAELAPAAVSATADPVSETEPLAPAAERTPVPAAERTPVPAAERTPAPAAEPATETSPAPAAERTPVPAAERTPVPAAERTPAPAAEPATETSPAPAAEPATDAETEVAEEVVGEQILQLPEPRLRALERHYGLARDSVELIKRVRDDVVSYVNQGAKAVAAVIRNIIKTIADGVLATAVIFNPVGLQQDFQYNPVQIQQRIISETRADRAEVPAEAQAQMSDAAKSVYENMAPVAKETGKGFVIADKPNGAIHFFMRDGSVLVQDAALYGKQAGDKGSGKSALVGGAKITPAGPFTLKAQEDSEFAGGMRLDLAETLIAGEGVIAVHAAYFGDAKEDRAGRLTTASADDNKISYGCINTSHDTFLEKVMPNIEEFNGGMIFVLPDQSSAEAMFPARTTTETRTETRVNNSVSGAKTRSANSGREQTGGAEATPGAQEASASFSRRRGQYRDIADGLGLTPAQYRATALPLMTGLTKDQTFKTPKAGALPETVAWLDERRAESGSPKLDLNEDADRTVLASMMAAEAVAAIRSAGNAVEWYDETVAKTLRTMAVKYKELNTDPNARNAFLMAMAISSQTMNVEDNLKFASAQYEAFRATKKFPERGSGKSAPAMAKNFKLANRLLAQLGPEMTRRFLQTSVTKRELESLGFSISGELMDEVMLGSAVFGPKIGFGFYSNLAGNFEPVTMDMWFMRTIGRLSGTLPAFDENLFPKQVAKLRAALKERGSAGTGVYALQFDKDLVNEARDSDDGAIALARQVYSLHNRQFINERAKFDSGVRRKTSLVSAATSIIKSADKPNDMPGSGGKRRLLRDVVRQMVDMVTEQTGKRHPPAALQALIWYPEQELYKSLGVRLRVTSQDYAGAAQSLLQKEGFDERRIRTAAESGSGRARPMADGPVGRAAGQARSGRGATGPLEGAERDAFISDRAARIQERKAAGEVKPKFSRQRQTDTPAFQKWFGDSKVVDADGEPMVVYHGTRGSFDAFNRAFAGQTTGAGARDGFFFTTDPKEAGSYAGGSASGGNILPVYLSIQKPAEFSFAEHGIEDIIVDDDKLADMLRSARGLKSRFVSGTDGLILRDIGGVEGKDLLIAFRPEQIKSATGNNGDFDRKNASITASRQRRNIFAQPAPLANWTQPTDTKFDDFIYTMQDKQIDTKRVVEAIKAAAGKIDDKWNAYLQEELYHGRTATATKNFLTDELRPLMQDMQARGLKMDEVEEYLHNRHAEERNIQIASINDAFPDDGTPGSGGSGIDTPDARAYLAGLDPAKRRSLEALALRVDAINKGSRDLLVASGLETQDTIDTWESTYSKYVPLFREDLDFSSNESLQGTGQGYQVKGAASKRATGSNRNVVDILANVAMQRERAIVRSEKTRVGQALYGMAVQYPNTDFWLAVDPAGQKDPRKAASDLVAMGINPVDAKNIIEEPTQPFTDPKTGLVTYRVNPLLRSSDNVMAVRINGEEKYVFFNANDPRSQRMATALKNLDADQMGRMMSMTATVTRYFASINTQYNPIFGAINFLRDAQGAVFNLATTPIADRKTEVYGNVAPALAGIYKALRADRDGQKVTGKWATLWDEFQMEGGQTGFRDLFSKSQERAEALQTEINRIEEGKLKQFGRGIFDWLSDYNESMENAVRLAAYDAAKGKGLSNAQAASIAKNLTVNFNRKGQVGQQAGALYAFFNAAVQGTARLGETLTENPQPGNASTIRLSATGKKIMAGGLLLGTAQAVLLAAAGFDEDEPPEYIKERNLIIPTGNGKYIQIPMPLGLNVIPNTSRVLTEYFLNGRKEPGKALGNIFGAFIDMFNPIGNAGWSVQTLTPTLLDPIAALSENRDYTGKSIAKQDMSNLDPTPGYTRAKETASVFSKELSYYLNLASGGTKYKPGVVSPTPDQLDYLIGQATGGVGRELLKIEQSVTSSATGEELPPYKMPLVGRFYGDSKAGASESNRFYENVTRLNKHENEIKGRQKAREPVGDYLKEYPEARLYQQANKVERDVQELRAKKRELLARDASKETIKLVEQRITLRMKQLNDRVRQVSEQAD